MVTFWLLGEKWLLWQTQFFKTYVVKTFCFFFSVGTLIMKVQSNKMCVSIKTTIKIHFPFLWQLSNLQINKNNWRQPSALSSLFEIETNTLHILQKCYQSGCFCSKKRSISNRYYWHLGYYYIVMVSYLYDAVIIILLYDIYS